LINGLPGLPYKQNQALRAKPRLTDR